MTQEQFDQIIQLIMYASEKEWHIHLYVHHQNAVSVNQQAEEIPKERQIDRYQLDDAIRQFQEFLTRLQYLRRAMD